MIPAAMVLSPPWRKGLVSVAVAPGLGGVGRRLVHFALVLLDDAIPDLQAPQNAVRALHHALSYLGAFLDFDVRLVAHTGLYGYGADLVAVHHVEDLDLVAIAVHCLTIGPFLLLPGLGPGGGGLPVRDRAGRSRPPGGRRLVAGAFGLR